MKDPLIIIAKDTSLFFWAYTQSSKQRPSCANAACRKDRKRHKGANSDFQRFAIFFVDSHLFKKKCQATEQEKFRSSAWNCFKFLTSGHHSLTHITHAQTLTLCTFMNTTPVIFQWRGGGTLKASALRLCRSFYVYISLENAYQTTTWCLNYGESDLSPGD